MALVLCANARGQTAKPVKIEFAAEGDREVWIGPTATPGLFKDPVAATGLSITLDAPSDPAAYTLYAHDKKSGNVASKPLADAMKTGSWKVAAADEKRVFRLQFSVVSNGKPVAAAVVKAKAGKEEREALLTPESKGTVNVYNLPVGPVEVRVQYNSGGSTQTTPPQTFEAKLGDGPAKPHTLTVTGEVETMSETPTPGSSTATQPSDVKDDRGPDSRRDDRRSVEREAASAPNPLVSLLNLVIGLAVVGGLGYAVFTYYKKNTKQVDDALKKFGIGEQPPQDQTPAPPVPQQPQPLKPIVLDAAVPTAAVTPMATTTMVAANPRLVRPDGSVVLLQEGATTVGRDDGLGLSLIGESSVSRQHARFDRAGDSVRLTDLGSTNGTFVNGSRLQGETALSVGDSVQFGAVAFRFEA